MLLFQSILLASLSSATPGAPPAPAAHPGSEPVANWVTALLAPVSSWKQPLQLSLACSAAQGAARCISLLPQGGLASRAAAASTYGAFELKLPRRTDAFRTQGGFVHLDMVESSGLRVGPELSWSTPDSPREDLPRMRLLSPGWGVRFAWGASPVAVGVSACSRFVMVGKDLPVIDPITSEARFEFRLP